jgi:hypothetical protein
LGSASDTDLYSLDDDTKFTEDIYGEVISFINDLLSDKIYFGSKGNTAIFAEPNHTASNFRVYFHPKGIFGNGNFTTIKKEEWSREKIVDDPDLRQIIANRG